MVHGVVYQGNIYFMLIRDAMLLVRYHGAILQTSFTTIRDILGGVGELNGLLRETNQF